MSELTLEQIEENFETFANLCEKLGETRKDKAEKFIEHFSERLASCPAATKTAFSGAYHGGLIEQNLAVLKNALLLNKTFELRVKKSSILLCCLFRNIGNLGTRDEQLLEEQENEWRRNNMGEMFKYNQKLNFMAPVDRTTFLMQQFGFDLSEDEYLALRLSGTRMNEEYSMNEPPLAFLVYSSARIAMINDKK